MSSSIHTIHWLTETAGAHWCVGADVVWNHLDGNNILSLYDGWSEKQAGFPSNAGAPQGIYYFQDENAVTEWGPRPNYASPAVQEYILQSIATWMKECRISGFRWDSTICIRKVRRATHARMSARSPAGSLSRLGHLRRADKNAGLSPTTSHRAFSCSRRRRP